MIVNIKKFIKNAREIHPITESTFQELEKLSDSKRRARAKTITLNRFGGVERNEETQHLRTLWEVNSQSGNNTYEVTLEIQPKNGTMFKAVSDMVSGGKLSKDYLSRVNMELFSSDILVHCSCPDFYWSGMKYNLGPRGKHAGSLVAGKNAGYAGGAEPDIVGDDLAPDKRDPGRRHVLCKHIIGMRPLLRPNTPKVVKAIRDYLEKFGAGEIPSEEAERNEKEGKPTLKKMVKLEGDERDEFVEDITGRAPMPELSKEEENVGGEEIIEDESKVIEPKEVPEEVPDEVLEEPEEEKETMAEEVIQDISTEDDLDEEGEIEETPGDILGKEDPNEEEEPLEKDKPEGESKSNIDPNEIL